MDKYFVSAAFLGLAIVFAVARFRIKPRHPLPPGPVPKLLTGNAHQIPTKEPWRTYADWAAKYGPLTYLRIFGRRIVILNKAGTVNDLLESRSSSYSDRPIFWMYGELVGRKLAVFNISSLHPRFRIYRSTLKGALGTHDMVERYRLLQHRESIILLRNLYKNPQDFINHFLRNAGATILEMAYGWRVETDKDYLVGVMQEVVQLQAEAARPGRWLVDTYPFLRHIPAWVPGASFQRKAAKFREEMDKITQFPHQWAQEQIASHKYLPSFTSMNLLNSVSDEPLSLSEQEEDIIRWCSSALYTGGADTTVSALTSFILLMTLNPSAQRQAQNEIDSVVGQDRLPSIEDRGKLPYVSALIKEVLRCGPPAPLGIPHRVTKDDTYLGYSIPSDAILIANIWGIMHDAEMYPDPMKFSPERFLSQKSQPDPRKYVFGFGRRVCPGQAFAEDSIFYNFSRILATFDIQKAIDEQTGLEVDPVVEYTTAITSRPKPFQCRILPRGGRAGMRLNELQLSI